MNFLHEDTFVTRLLGRMMDLILLNVIWLLCCIPIVTIGTATAALYDVLFKIDLNEEVRIFSDFFRAFRKNVKKGTILWLLTFFVGAFLLADYLCALQWDVSFKFIIQIMIISAAYFYLAMATHIFPALAYFDEAPLITIKKSFLLAMKNGIFTVFIMLLNLTPLLLFILAPVQFFKCTVFFLAIGFALIAWLCSMHIIKLFDPERVNAAEASDTLLNQ
jgi:uncharacterized membrane protein YesL